MGCAKRVVLVTSHTQTRRLQPAPQTQLGRLAWSALPERCLPARTTLLYYPYSHAVPPKLFFRFRFPHHHQHLFIKD